MSLLGRNVGPYGQEGCPNGVKAFYDAGALACVALDAVTAPQVFRAGSSLADSDPGRGRQFLLGHDARAFQNAPGCARGHARNRRLIQRAESPR